MEDENNPAESDKNLFIAVNRLEDECGHTINGEYNYWKFLSKVEYYHRVDVKTRAGNKKKK